MIFLSPGFVEFKHEEDADYCVRILNMVKLFQKPIRVNKSAQDKKNQEVGANLFIGNLDTSVDEKTLYDTFASFGVILFAKVMRDPDTGESRGFGFISFDTFDASDAALAAMNGQFLANQPINISYAYKKETKGERHGTAAERLLAANNPTASTGTAQRTAEPKPLASSGPPPMDAGKGNSAKGGKDKGSGKGGQDKGKGSGKGFDAMSAGVMAGLGKGMDSFKGKGKGNSKGPPP